MKKILLGVLFFAYMQISLAQLRVDANSQLHIGGTSPTERLDVNGAIRIGTTSNTNAGTIRYLSNVFEGYNGTDWVDLSSPSKWTLAGNNIYFNTGKVGIGGAPATAFEIKDNGSRMRFQRSSAIDGIVIGDSEQNFAIATRVQGASAIPINSYLFFNHSLGNFGVNTLSPTTDFHIQGDFRLTGGFYDSFVSTGSIGQILTSTITGTKWTNLSELGQWLESGSNLYTLGNVGIGTTTPFAKLDVNGDALISSIDIGKGNNELSDNTVFGVLAGTAITSGNYNTFIGKNTGIANTTGEKNTFFGRQAGYSNITGSDNVFIGHQAGYNETGSDKLYIDNSSTSTPLIGGDFATDEITVNGDLIVKSGEGINLPTAGNGIGFGANDTWKMAWGGSTVLSYFRNSGNKVAEWVGVSSNAARFAMQQYSVRGTADNYPAYSFLQDGDTGLVLYDPNEVGLVTGGVTRLICMADGDTGIGTDAPSEKLDVNGNARFRSIGSGTSSGALHYESDGTLTTNTSDIRLKKNIKTLKNPLKKIQKLRGVKYNWKDENNPTRQIGLIAQEVETEFCELVFINPVDGFKGVHYDKVVAVLIEGMKAQQAQIEQLQKDIKKLKKRK